MAQDENRSCAYLCLAVPDFSKHVEQTFVK